MLVEMTLARIVIFDSDEDKASIIILRECDGERSFPILIGVHEAYAIDRRTKGITMQRPLTHDLIEKMLHDLDCQLEHVVIHNIEDSTFFAKLVVRRNGDLVEIDSRPSDAIAVGAGTDAPIYVDDSVLEEVC